MAGETTSLAELVWGREETSGQINALDRVQNMAAKFAHHRNDSNWETLTEHRKNARICALFIKFH
jgi:hypothetical protein